MTSRGRIALVTGSTSGIGAATARRLAADGDRVIVTGRDVDRGRAVVESIRQGGGEAEFVVSGLDGGPGELRDVARTARDVAGGVIEVVVHNAAVCPAVDTLTLSDADLEQVWAVNVRAPQVLTAALVPEMLEHGRGAIVVLGSWMAGVGHPIAGMYSASKAAQVQLARSWAAEFGARGIRVNTVAPGAVRTPVNAASDDVIAQLTAGLPAGRPGTPEEIAAAISWLASDEAGYLHGATLAVDGGITSTGGR